MQQTETIRVMSDGKSVKASTKTLENTPSKELIDAQNKAANKLVGKMKIGPRPGRESAKGKKNGNGKTDGQKVDTKQVEPKKTEPKKTEPKKTEPQKAKKSNPKSGVQILLDCIRQAGPKGLTKDEIIKRLEGKMPNKNPQTMIPRTLDPYLTGKGLIEKKDDRYTIKKEGK